MRVRLVTALGLIALSSAGVMMGAGTASAFEPVHGKGVIVGVRLNHAETQAIANSPLPMVLGALAAPVTGIVLAEGSPTPTHPDGSVAAPMTRVWSDMAADPNGEMIVALVNPGDWRGRLVITKQMR